MVVLMLDKKSLTLITVCSVLVGAALFAGGVVSGLYWSGGAAPGGEPPVTVAADRTRKPVQPTVARPEPPPAAQQVTADEAPASQPAATPPTDPAQEVPAAGTDAPAEPVDSTPTAPDPASAQPVSTEPVSTDPPPPTQQLSARDSRLRFAVQVAAYALEANARRDSSALAAAGYRPSIRSLASGRTSPLYLVLLGEFPDQQAASRLALEFKSRESRPAFVRSLDTL